MSESRLLDGRTRVASDQLVLAMIRAAFLAQERAGAVRLERETRAGQPCVVVAPTGAGADFPDPTLEARLLPAKRSTITDIVYDWLDANSPDPWRRAVEQVRILFVLRGLATVSRTRAGRRRYTSALTPTPDRDFPDSSPQPVLDLLDACRRNRPEIWDGLTRDIEAAVKRRRGEATADADPWLAESIADQLRFGARERVTAISDRAALIAGLAIAVFDGWLAVHSGAQAFALQTAAVLAVVLAISVMPFGFLRAIERKSLAAALRGGLIPQDLLALPVWGWRQRAIGAWLGLAVITLLVLIARIAVPTWAIGVLAAAALLGVSRVVRSALAASAAVAISARVSGRDAVPAPARATDTPAAATALNDGLRKPANPAAQIALEVTAANALPPASDESRHIFAAVEARGPAVRAAYRKAAVLVSGATTAIKVAFSLATHTSLPYVWLASFGVTVLMVNRRTGPLLRRALVAIVLSLTTGAEVKIKKAADDAAEPSTIRPIALPLLSASWLILLIGSAAAYRAATDRAGILFAWVSVAVAGGFLYWLRGTLRALERRYPYQPPLNLLALRVFNSPHLTDFLELASGWQWFGTRQMLDGPDTVGQKMSDLLHYVSGRLDDSIVKNSAELAEALKAFSAAPDRQLRFPVNSIQCSDASWKPALHALLDAADVVVMDLSDLSERNRGIAYELTTVIDRVELRRIVLLAGDSTDVAVLQDVLAHAWINMSPTSPNRGRPQAVRLYHIGGPLKRLPEESVAAWKKRLSRQLDPNRLVCLLYDAAQPRRRAAAVNRRIDARSIHWTRMAPPRALGLLRNAAFGFALLLVVLVSGC